MTAYAYSQSPAPGVLDAAFISERHHVYMEHLDIGGDVWDNLTSEYRKGTLNLSAEDSSFIDNNYSGYYRSQIGIPYSPLYHEDDHWALRVYKTVDLETSYQGVFWDKGPARHRYFRESDGSTRTDTVYNETGYHVFKLIIQAGILMDRITPYLDEYYTQKIDWNRSLPDTLVRDSLGKLTPLANKIVLKEDYFYNKYTGETDSKIIAMGFYQGDKELFWCYYPELSYSLRNNFLFFDHDLNWQLNTTYDEIFKNQLYDVSEIEYKTHKIETWRWRPKEPDLSQFTEMNALFQVDLMKDYIEANYRNYSGIVNHPVHNGYTLSTELQNGQIQGKCAFITAEQQTVVSVEFKNHMPHGNYVEYHSNGKLKENGRFEMGLKTGKWIDYSEKGKVLAERNYQNGWMQGEQNLYYSNGKPFVNFTYDKFMLNGPYERFSEKGKISEKGFFTNNYPDKNWEINLELPEEFIRIVKSNKQAKWYYPVDAYLDGVLSYQVELEVGPKETNCPTPVFTCVSLLNMSEVK